MSTFVVRERDDRAQLLPSYAGAAGKDNQVTARDRLDWIDAVSLDRRVPAEAFRLAHVLQSRFINDKTGEAWPAQETLAALLAIGGRQVRYHIEKLIVLGWLEKRRGGKGQPNRYSLTGNMTAAHGAVLSGNRIADQENSLTGNGMVLDRQSGGILTGNGIADKLVENSPKNFGGSVKRPPGRAPRSNVEKRSTLKGSRDAGPSAASLPSPKYKFRVGDSIDAEEERFGKCEIVLIEGACVIVRSSRTSQCYECTIDYSRRTITNMKWHSDPDGEWFSEHDERLNNDNDEDSYEDADDDAA